MTAHELAILAAADAAMDEDEDEHERQLLTKRRFYARHAERLRAEIRARYAKKKTSPTPTGSTRT